jgi:hypothetical protein
VVWVDFRFASIGQSALPFLRRCVQGVGAILVNLRADLE